MARKFNAVWQEEARYWGVLTIFKHALSVANREWAEEIVARPTIASSRTGVCLCYVCRTADLPARLDVVLFLRQSNYADCCLIAGGIKHIFMETR